MKEKLEISILVLLLACILFGAFAWAIAEDEEAQFRHSRVKTVQYDDRELDCVCKPKN